MTLTDLAERVTLSVSRRQRRVRALEDAGVLRGYRAVVDAAALGLRFEVLAFVTLGRPEAIKDFDTALADAPQIIGAQRLFGESDYSSASSPPTFPPTRSSTEPSSSACQAFRVSPRPS